MLLKRLFVLIATMLTLTSLAYAGGGNGAGVGSSEVTQSIRMDHYSPMGGGIGHKLGAAGN